MKVYSSPDDLVNREARDKLAKKIEGLLPSLSESQRSLFDRIVSGFQKEELSDLSLKDLKSLYSLCERTLKKDGDA